MGGMVATMREWECVEIGQAQKCGGSAARKIMVEFVSALETNW